MATTSTRTLWKGAISFGLVHVPIALHSAVEDIRPKMRMLDQSGAEVGYKKVVKATGQEVAADEVVKGVELEDKQFVTLTKDEIREALPKSTQTIEIETFVKLHDVPTVYFNKPYYVSPINRGHKVYALLRDVLSRTGRVGLGRIVVSSRQHLALVVSQGNGLVVNLLRWEGEIRDMAGLDLPAAAGEVGLTERELKMGEQLVLDLTDDWHPERFHDDFADKVAALVEAKRQAGDVKRAAHAVGEEAPPTADVIDLTELLRRSLKRPAAPAPEPARKADKPSAGAKKAANDDRPERAVAAASKAPAKARAAVKSSKRPAAR